MIGNGPSNRVRRLPPFDWQRTQCSALPQTNPTTFPHARASERGRQVMERWRQRRQRRDPPAGERRGEERERTCIPLPAQRCHVGHAGCAFSLQLPLLCRCGSSIRLSAPCLICTFRRCRCSASASRSSPPLLSSARHVQCAQLCLLERAGKCIRPHLCDYCQTLLWSICRAERLLSQRMPCGC